MVADFLNAKLHLWTDFLPQHKITFAANFQAHEESRL